MEEAPFTREPPSKADLGKCLVGEHPLQGGYRTRGLVRRRHQHRQAFGCAGTHIGIRILDQADQLRNKDVPAEASIVGRSGRAQQPDDPLSR